MDIDSIRRQVIAFPTNIHEGIMQLAELEDYANALNGTINDAIIEDAAGDATRHELLEAWREIIDLRMQLIRKSI